MLICASCGQDNSVGARFCNGCGAALAAMTAPREVRKTEVDNVRLQSWTHEDLKAVLECAGRIDEARAALGRAKV